MPTHGTDGTGNIYLSEEVGKIFALVICRLVAMIQLKRAELTPFNIQNGLK
jgi:hypothetical protein